MKTITTVILSAIVGALALGLVLAWNPFGGGKNRVDLSRPAIVERLQKLSRLTTASFTMDKTVEAGTEGNIFKEFLFGDKILLLASGQVDAGFDLAGISAEDVVVKGGEISIQAPLARILASRLDNGATRVFDRKLGIFTKGDKDLESEARAAAEASIVSAACEAGILDRAGENLKAFLEPLLLSLGFSKVTIILSPATCGK
jgi:hypothetical protein